MIKEIIKELALTKDQLDDKEINHFVKDVAFRKQTGDWFQYWNGKIKNFYAKFIIKEI